MTITEEEYKLAVKNKAEAEKVINAYHREQAEAFKQRLIDNPIFTDEELLYAAEQLCPCGHGMAYPKGCGTHHHWSCSAKLKGIADPQREHRDNEPFAFCDIKSESEYRGTTRGKFLPRAGG